MRDLTAGERAAIEAPAVEITLEGPRLSELGDRLGAVLVALDGASAIPAGFAPITLAKEAGIFKKNGLDVTIKKIPQKDRHLAIASGDVQCAATTVETWIASLVSG